MIFRLDSKFKINKAYTQNFSYVLYYFFITYILKHSTFILFILKYSTLNKLNDLN